MDIEQYLAREAATGDFGTVDAYLTAFPEYARFDLKGKGTIRDRTAAQVQREAKESGQSLADYVMDQAHELDISGEEYKDLRVAEIERVINHHRVTEGSSTGTNRSSAAGGKAIEPLPFIHLAERGARKDKATAMLVEGLIPAGLLTVPYGLTGHGKSYVMAELAYCLATGKPVFGHLPVTKAGIVVMFIGEEPDAFVDSRLVALQQCHGLDPANNVVIIPEVPRLDHADHLAQSLATLELIATRGPIVAVFIETLSRMLGSLPAKEDTTGSLFTRFTDDVIRVTGGAAVIVSAHSPKSGDRTIAGTQNFLNNAAVTPYIIREHQRQGADRDHHQLRAG